MAWKKFVRFMLFMLCGTVFASDDIMTEELPAFEPLPIVAPDDHVFQQGTSVPNLQLNLWDEEIEEEELPFIETDQDSIFVKKFDATDSIKVSSETKRLIKKELKQSWMIPTKEVNKRFEVAVATSVSKTGANHIMGSHCFEGMMLYFNTHNKTTSNGKLMVRMYSENDASNIIKAKKNIDFLKNSSPVLIGLLGDQIINEVSSYLYDKSLIALFPICGSSQERAKPQRNKVYFRPSHHEEIDLLIRYALKVLRRESFGIIYEESAWGRSIRDKFVSLLKENFIEPVVVTSYPPETVNVAGAVKEMVAKAPGIIFCAAHARPATVFIRWALNKGLYKSVFLGLSELSAIQNAIRQLRGIEVITSSVVPDPLQSEIPLVKTFRSQMKINLPHRLISPFFLEGYINGRLFIEALKNMKRPFTTMRLIKSLESFSDMSLDGLPISFNKKTRTLSSAVWVNQGKEKPYLSRKEVEAYA